MSPIKTSVLLIRICLLLRILNSLKKKKSIKQSLSVPALYETSFVLGIQRLRPDPVHGEGCKKHNMLTDAYSTLKSSAMDVAAVDIYYGNKKSQT